MTDSPGNGATKYFGSPQDIAPEKGAAPKRAAYSAKNIGLRTERMNARDARNAAKKARDVKKKEQAKEAKKTMAAIEKSLAKVLRDQDIDQQTKIIDSIALRGLEHAHGLLVKQGEEGYNPDADVPMPDATTRTRFGMDVYKQMMAQRREGMVTARALGVVLLQGRQSEEDWNENARRVDEAQRRAHAIDVAAEMIKSGEVKVDVEDE